jgi:transposase InsO family protein
MVFLRSTSSKSVHLADKTSLKILGIYEGKLHIDGTEYNAKLNVVESLVVPLIIGMDLLRQHSKIVISLGGSRKPVEFCVALRPIHGTPKYRLLPGVEIDSLSPIAVPSRRHTPHMDFIEAEIQRLLKEDIIQESQSPWRAQCFVTNLTKKPRLVIDFSATINKFTPMDSYPSARIDVVLEKIAVNRFFSTIDLRSAYHQVALHPDDYSLTAFEACGKLYEFKRLPFGCRNAVAIFQRTMDNFISANGLTNTYAYLDDIIIGGRSKEEHDHNLAAFQKAAASFGLQINDSKCAYSQQQINFLGHNIQNGTFRPDTRRVESLLNFPEPRNITQLNRLIGLFAYYAKWIPHYSDAITPLLNARTTISKDQRLCDDTIAAIQRLKSSLSESTLSAPQFGIPYTIETDASENALGGSLSQCGKPVAFMSRTLTHSERKQSVVEREACAIIECCRRWRHLLLSAPSFTIVTDQKSVSFLFSTRSVSKIKNEKLIRWRLELSEYHFDVVYRPGSENAAADALSRVACALTSETGQLTVLHKRLCHPGVRRFYHYVRTRNLPNSLAEVRQVVNACATCKELKPRYFNPPPSSLITSTRPWKRLSMDFVGPMPSASPNKYLLVIVDEYSRYPFAFPCSRMTDDVVISHLLHLFSMFGTPSAIHSDRGAQFESRKLKEFLLRNGVAKSRTSPFRPQGNGQCERINGSIQKAIQLARRTYGLDKTRWEQVLPVALSSLRSLLCIATNCIPHDRIFAFQRSSVIGSDLPEYLLNPGGEILHRKHISLKGDTPTEKVKLVETISPYFARVEFPSGRIDTVSTRNLAPYPRDSDSTDDTMVEDIPRSEGTPSYSEEPIKDSSPCSDRLPQMVPFSLTSSPGTSLETTDPSTGEYVTRSGRIVKAPLRYQS